MPDTELRFQRANYVVADLDRALSFYVDILGMQLEFRKVSEPDSYSYPVFEIPKEAGLGFAVLSTAEQPRVMALTEVTNTELPAVPNPRRAAIVLATPAIDDIVSRSRGAGLLVYPEEHLVTNDGREGREVGIVDFDGNLVVLYWITSTPA